MTGATYPREFKGRAIQPMEGVSLRPAFAGGRISANAADLLGARRAIARFARASGSSCRRTRMRWELYDMIADRVERQRRAHHGTPTSSGRSRPNGRRGPNAPTWIGGRGRA